MQTTIALFIVQVLANGTWVDFSNPCNMRIALAIADEEATEAAHGDRLNVRIVAAN